MGGTAIYDTVAEAIPRAQSGTNKKKALVVISDGNDTSSHMRVPQLQQLIRESEVLVYAIGIDASNSGDYSSHSSSSTPNKPSSPPPSQPVPAPFPGAPRPQAAAPKPTPAPPPQSSSRQRSSSSVDRVNPDALRAITDDSGGRTEIIVSPRDLDPATSGIADELSRQYFIGYVSSAPKDGKWHTIDVQLRKGSYVIRARKGFIAS